MYNNLIYFLVVILILTTNAASTHPQVSTFFASCAFLLKGTVYLWLLKRIFSPLKVTTPGKYAKAERQGSILAILIFSLDIYLLDCQYYMSLLPLTGKLPVIVSFLSLLLVGRKYLIYMLQPRYSSTHEK